MLHIASDSTDNTKVSSIPLSKTTATTQTNLTPPTDALIPVPETLIPVPIDDAEVTVLEKEIGPPHLQ